MVAEQRKTQTQAVAFLRYLELQRYLKNVEERMMNAPMILPWLARKWRVSDARALELWRQACREAEAATGKTSSSRYWGIAKRRMFDLLDNEVIARYPVVETPWVMIQLNLLHLVATIRSKLGIRERAFSPAI